MEISVNMDNNKKGHIIQIRKRAIGTTKQMPSIEEMWFKRDFREDDIRCDCKKSYVQDGNYIVLEDTRKNHLWIEDGKREIRLRIEDEKALYECFRKTNMRDE